MSSLVKMQIQGIRSFGVDDVDKGVISFQHPLTLIVGQNGAGKTTIIECLKYITTGEMPPGSRQSFVHDPKLVDIPEVRAQIRLLMHDTHGREILACRSLAAVQKAKKLEVRTLDSSIARWNEKGEKKSLTTKCADLDREMMSALGVGKSVLSNVIFCHQDDSTWPLSEGKVLKEKFDSIFEATRYNKALDNIRKIKQEKDKDVKQISIELKYLKMNRDKASDIKDDLKKALSRSNASKETVDNIRTSMEPIDDELDTINKIRNEIYQLDMEKTEIEANIRATLLTAKELGDALCGHIFDGSDTELTKALHNQKHEFTEKNLRVESLKNNQIVLEKDIKSMEIKRKALLNSRAKLGQEIESHKLDVQKRDELISKFASDYSIPGYGQVPFSSDAVRKFRDQMRGCVLNKVNARESVKKEFDNKLKLTEDAIKSILEEKSSLEQTIKIKTKSVDDVQRKLLAVQKDLQKAVSTVGKIESMTKTISDFKDELTEISDSISVVDIQNKIDNLNLSKEKVDESIKLLDGEQSTYYRNSQISTKLNILKGDLSTQKAQLEKIKNRHSDDVAILLGSFPEKNYKTSILRYINKRDDDLSASQSLISAQEKKIASTEGHKLSLRNQSVEKEAEIRVLEEKLSFSLGSQELESELEELKKSVNQLQDDKGALIGSTHMLRQYQKKLEERNPCCPLCHRNFEDRADAVELISELECKVSMVPKKIALKDKDVRERQSKIGELADMKPVVERLQRLKGEITTLKSKIIELELSLSALKAEISAMKEDKSLIESDLSIGRSMIGDFQSYDRLSAEVINTNDSIDSETAKLTGDISGVRPINEVEAEKKQLERKTREISLSMKNYAIKKDDYNWKVNDINSKINELTEQKLQMTSLHQGQQQFLVRKKELSDQLKQLKDDIGDCQDQHSPVEEQYSLSNQRRVDMQLERDNMLEEMQMESSQMRSQGKEIADLSRCIHAFVQNNKHQQHNDAVEELELQDSEIYSKQNDAMLNRENIVRLNEMSIKQDLVVRRMNDNVTLRAKRREISALEAKVEKLKLKLKGHDPGNLDKTRKQLLLQQEILNRDKYQAEGRLRQLDEEIDKMEKELRTEMYKHIENKYMKELVKRETYVMASEDLEKYYRALDKAIMTYHQEKMSEINIIMKDLWDSTYRGHDIDTIEIKHDEEASASLSRRSYNYRVIMVKNGCRLDMRGRCSAGQKIFASLIIRLALAEVFCSHCGILTLDEPTTNLDRDNIESLARALVDIIRNHENQKNFQLVIITHDEEFVELLGRSGLLDFFYRVTKDNNRVLSRISKHGIRDWMNERSKNFGEEEENPDNDSRFMDYRLAQRGNKRKRGLYV